MLVTNFYQNIEVILYILLSYLLYVYIYLWLSISGDAEIT